MIAVLVIFGLSVAGLGIGLIAASLAPAGYQDKSGFHYGQVDGMPEEAIPCGVHPAAPQPKLA
jgi:hypothetical protein